MTPLSAVENQPRKPHLHVALALIHQADRWLVARRHADAHLGNLWEFPGGKLEAGETPAQAAVREAYEECAVEVAAEATLDPVVADYPERHVTLHPVVCRWIAGDAAALASQACRWVVQSELAALPMPAANGPIQAALQRWLRQPR